MIYNLYKQKGDTPLECIRRFIEINPGIERGKMAYMGRLDPLAEGVLLMASGRDVKRKEEFLGLDKEYDFVCIFGFATDTYDVLGKILKVRQVDNLNEAELIKIAEIYEGEREQKYPLYSSKMIAKRTSSPVSKRVIIYKLQFHKLDTLSNKELFGRLLMDISRVKGDFRQHEILLLWKKILLDSDNSKLPSLNIREGLRVGYFSAHVSSGTYIRSLVNDMGNTLGCGATTLSIKRTRVGDYRIEDSLK